MATMVPKTSSIKVIAESEEIFSISVSLIFSLYFQNIYLVLFSDDNNNHHYISSHRYMFRRIDK